MTREKFIKVLDREGYSYDIVGDKIIVKNKGDVNLNSLETLPPGVDFKNEDYVYLRSLKTLPPGVEFNNRGAVYLDSLKTLPPGVEFNNRGRVFLKHLETIPPDVKFNNKGYDVFLSSLVGGYFWNGNIRGIAPNTLLNGMIKRGLFL